MKLRFLIYISLMVNISMNCLALRLNERGQKMVREIEVNRKNGSEYTIITKYLFYYDDNSRLNGLDIYEGLYDRDKEEYCEPVKIQHQFRYNNYNLTHKSFDPLYRMTEWEYEFDEGSKLVKEIKYAYGTEGDVSKRETDYGYDYDNERKEYHLAYHIMKFSEKYSKDAVFVRERSKATPVFYLYENGFLNRKGNNIEASNIINDTNLSFSWVHNGYGDLNMTEWLCMRSEYMPQMKQPHFRKFDYTFDDKGNIVNIKLRDKDSGFVSTEVWINYLED